MLAWWSDKTIRQVWQWQGKLWTPTQEYEEGAHLWGGIWWKQLGESENENDESETRLEAMERRVSEWEVKLALLEKLYELRLNTLREELRGDGDRKRRKMEAA